MLMPSPSLGGLTPQPTYQSVEAQAWSLETPACGWITLLFLAILACAYMPVALGSGISI